MKLKTIVETFEQYGVFRLQAFFPPNETAELLYSWNRMKPEIGTTYPRNARFVLGELPGALGSLPQSKRLLKIAERICGGPVSVYRNRVLLKDRSWRGGVTLHQDLPYFDGPNKLSVFVPLAPVTLRDGPMTFIPGSHKMGRLPRGTVRLDQFNFNRQLVSNHYTPELKPGDIILMDFLTWHSSVPSETANERPLVQIAYEHAGNPSETPQNSHLALLFDCPIPNSTIPDE